MNPAKTEYEMLAAQYGTPFYLFDFDVLKERVAAIKARLPKNARLCYAVKANAFLLHALKDEDILFEVCSPGELSICERLSIQPNRIVFSGVHKTSADVQRACALGVHTITVESLAHCDYLLQAVRAEQISTQNVIIRLTSGNQFGMSADDVYECVARLHSAQNVTLRGIHFFTGTQKKLQTITEEVAFIQQFCDDVRKRTGVAVSDIEYGPGLGYNYFSANDERNTFVDLEQFAALLRDSAYQFVVELGRFVAAPCGVYVTRIGDVKNDGKNRYCIIDGGIHHINYYGQMMGMKLPRIEHIPHTARNGTEELPYTIAGSLCTTADIVVRKLPLVSPAIGDVLAFHDIGAYSVTEGIYLFLSHPLPAVLVRQNGTVTCLRNAEETHILNA